MTKYKLTILIDKIFITSTIFLIIFSWLNFYIKSIWTSFLASLIISGAIVYLLFKVLGKKQEKTQATKKNIDDINKSWLSFRLTSQPKRLELLKSIISKNVSVISKSGNLFYTINEKKHMLIITTQYDKITLSELLNIIENYRNLNIDYIDIVCQDYMENLTNIFIDKRINFINKARLYKEYFLPNGLFPDMTNINTSAVKLKFKDIISSIFVPQKAKAFFFCALILIFSSIILPYNAYYVIVGSMLMCFALICKILPYFKNEK